MSKHLREKELILASAAYLLSGDGGNGPARAELAGLDWEYVLWTGAHHGLNPAIFKMITDGGMSEAVPVSSLETLKRNYLSTLMSNQHLYSMLNSVLDPFRQQGIPVMLLKGSALCLTVYDDIALRPFSDIDFLVPEDTVGPAKKEMLAAGFTVIENNYFPIPDEQNDMLGCEWAYHRDGAVFELHWGLVTRLAPFSIDIDLFWDGAIEKDLDGRPALIMDPANQLIHLCLHQFKHHWMHLRDLVDVTLILNKQKDDIDWDKLIANARSQGVERCVYYTMMLSRMVLGAPVEDAHMTRLLGRRRPNFFSGALLELIADNILESHLPRRFWELLLVTGAKNKLKVIKDAIAHPFPREMMGRQSAPSEKPSRSEQVKSALSSVFFYRHLAAQFLRKASSRIIRPGGR